MKLDHGVKFASPLFALCLLASIALAAFNFPELAGRVTDQANILTAPAKASIETKLRNLEDKSGIQLVVATVSSLEGGDIESYANGLFAGFVHGYLTYDLLHYFIHRGRLPGRIGRFLRQYHMAHHYTKPEKHFGVSSPLWDVVFRTR